MKVILNLFWRLMRLFFVPFLVIACPLVVLVARPSWRQELSPAEINSRVNTMLAKLTLTQKIYLIDSSKDGYFTHAMPKIGLPALKESDASMGVRAWGPSIAYAAGIGLAASWDAKLAREVGASIGRDARARGVNILLGPGMNIYQLPVDGRNFEFLGEDPYLAGQIAAHYILGVQSEDVVATAKHFDANNSEYDRGQENAIIGMRALREIYLPAFEAAVKEGHVGFIMNSYNLVNGEHSTQNKFLDTTVLRKDWHFHGVVMSDYGATHNGIAAANAGLDLENPDSKYMNARTLLPAIKEGKVSVATINAKVRHLLYVAVKFGFINHDQPDLHIPLYNRHSLAVALQSARESMVLLKNQGHLLPLDMNHIHSIAVIGPDAYPAEASAGGSAHVTAIAPVSFLQGLTNSFIHTQIFWNQGVRDLSSLLGRQRFWNLVNGNFSTDAQGNHPGLTQEEFTNRSFTGTPASSSVVRGVRFWSGNAAVEIPHKTVAVRWVGYYTPKTSGPQEFVAGSRGHDTYRLYVNGKMVLQGLSGRGEPQGVQIDLPAGKAVPIRFDYVPQQNQIRAGFEALPAEDMLQPGVRRVAAMADVVVLSVGYDPETEGEGHGRTYTLPPGQVQLIKAVSAANPHTIVVLTAGGSVATSGWLDHVPVFLQAWYGGSEAGRALAEVLAGKVDPSGKLPITWWKRVEDNPAYKNYYEEPGTHDVKYREGIFLGYRAYGRPGQPAPLFPFGYGLSYTRFAFSNLSVAPKEASPNGPITVHFDVQNVGSRAGAEVAEVYVGDPSANVPMPQKQLKGFERVMLKPGKSKEVSVTLNRRSLAYWSVKLHGWHVNPGKFVVYVGDSSEHMPLQAEFAVQ